MTAATSSSSVSMRSRAAASIRWRDDDRVDDGLGYAAKRLAGLRRCVVVPAVEVLMELHDLCLAGVRSGQSHGEVRRLGARAGEADALEGEA